MASGKKLYVARESFVCAAEDGSDIYVHAGETRTVEGSSLLKGREHLFDEIGVTPELEAATAAPGESRTRTSEGHARAKSATPSRGSRSRKTKKEG